LLRTRQRRSPRHPLETQLDNFFRDFRYTFCNLCKDRRLAFIAIFALALGIRRRDAILKMDSRVNRSPHWTRVCGWVVASFRLSLARVLVASHRDFASFVVLHNNSQR
jgi:hypothetical protein